MFDLCHIWIHQTLCVRKKNPWLLNPCDFCQQGSLTRIRNTPVNFDDWTTWTLADTFQLWHLWQWTCFGSILSWHILFVNQEHVSPTRSLVQINFFALGTPSISVNVAADAQWYISIHLRNLKNLRNYVCEEKFWILPLIFW